MKDLIVPCHMQTEGEFMMEAVREDGSTRPLTGWFHNLILNSGIDWILSRDNDLHILTRGYIGTGNTPEDVAQTALAEVKASVLHTASGGSHVTSATTTAPYYVETVMTYLFDTGVAAGNITEVGVGPSSGALFSRCLVRDENGDPTSISILPSEKLRLVYRNRMYYGISGDDYTGSITLLGETYNFTGRLHSLNLAYMRGTWSYRGWKLIPSADQYAFFGLYCRSTNNLLAAHTSNTYPTPQTGGAQLGPTGYEAPAYVSMNFYRDFVFVLADTVGNINPQLNWIAFFMNMGGFQFLFSPAIPKTSDYRLKLTFRFTVSRYAP